jgi:hypothetical protein
MAGAAVKEGKRPLVVLFVVEEVRMQGRSRDFQWGLTSAGSFLWCQSRNWPVHAPPIGRIYGP